MSAQQLDDQHHDLHNACRRMVAEYAKILDANSPIPYDERTNTAEYMHQVDDLMMKCMAVLYPECFGPEAGVDHRPVQVGKMTVDVAEWAQDAVPADRADPVEHHPIVCTCVGCQGLT